jgi:hypothetical protein
MNTQDKTTKARSETLQKYVSDMIAVEEQIGNALQRQTEDRDIYKHNPQASQIINDIAGMAERHEEHLKQHLESLGGDPAKGVKEIATTVVGTIAGIYGKMRNESVSKMLRDDYTALNLAAVSYEMLHTTGLALQDQTTADLALHHLKDYTSIIMEINQIIPSVVVADLRDDVPSVNETSIHQAIQNTQDAWRPSADNGSSSEGITRSGSSYTSTTGNKISSGSTGTLRNT